MTKSDSRISTVLAAKLASRVANGQPSGPVSDDPLLHKRKLLHSCVRKFGGREFGSGVEICAEFPDVLSAIRCAESIIANLREFGGSALDDAVQIGISLGEVREDGLALHGTAVEAAGALCALAGANEIVVAESVRGQAHERTDLAFRHLGTQSDLDASQAAYAVISEGEAKTGFGFIQELIRRRIFRAAGAYIIASWVVVQAASIVFPEFDAPNWSMRALIILLTAGFPLAVFLAWTIDITAKGLQRTPDSHYSRTKGNALRLGVVAVATAMSAGALWWVWTDYIEPGTQRPTRAEIKKNPVVAVVAPRKMAGASDIDWLGEGVANLLRDELAESSHVIVISQSRWNTIAADATTPDELHSIARAVGIDYLVEGDYLQSPGGLVFNTRVEDVENDTQIQGIRLDKNDAASVIAATSEISLGIKRALKIPLREYVGHYAADFAVQNMDAYEAYIAGLAYFNEFDYQLAEQSFDAALAIAPDFHMARYRRALVMQVTGRSELALLALNEVPTDADLTERERLYLEGAKASFTAEQDPARSIEIYEQFVNLYPYEMEAGQHLANSYWLDYREDDAIAEFRRLADLHSYDPSAWMALGERLLDVGELDEAERALLNYVDMAPSDHYAVALLGNLMQLRGEYAESIDYFNRSLALKPGFMVATLGLARSRYMAGDADAAESLWKQLIADTDQAAAFRIDAAFDLAGVLRGQGRFAEASLPLNNIADIVRQEGPRTAMMLSTLGLTALELDDYDRAAILIEQAIAESPGVPTRYLFARGMLELHQNRLLQLQNTAAEILALALPADDPDRTEDKAASFLLGLAALAQSNLETAADHLAAATTKDGYEYAIYALGLARLHLANGDHTNAALVAEQAMTASDPGDLRLDLEIDRARATLLSAEILALMGSHGQARERSQHFTERWHSASEQAPELLRARQLLSAD
jgi:tetratricopeptide (TPR) repeat protein